LEKLRKQVNDWIAEYFRQFSFKDDYLESEPWLLTFANKVLSHGDAIVSINYSCCLEGLLDHEKVWSPHGGYSQFVQNSVCTLADGWKSQENKLW